MAVRRNKDAGFVDAALIDLGGPRSGDLLARLDAAVPWEAITGLILQLPEYAGPSDRAGRRAWDPLVMVKAMMLAKWFNLSDPGLEEALKDRISFRRFTGLSFTDATPDETSFVRFRDRLRRAKLEEKVFGLIGGHIAGQGLLVREGTMVDATIVEQSRGRTGRDGDGQETTTRDPDATHCPKNGIPHFGYKAHAAADRSGIVTGLRFTTGSVHDSRVIDELVAGETCAVIADSAYGSHERRAELRRRGVGDFIAYKRVRGQKDLYDWQGEANHLIAKMRAHVEHPFAFLKQRMGWRKVRYRGLDRNRADAYWMFTAYNIRRMVHLQAARAA